MNPRPYQKPSIEALTKALPRFGVALDASDTGVGKTFVAAFTAKALGWPVAVVCPKAVIPSWRDALALVGVRALFIENVEKMRARQDWICKADKEWEWTLPERCLLVFDECFIEGTEVSTPNGPVLIEKVQVGDLVSTPYGPRAVVRTIKSEGRFPIVSCTNGQRSVTCTPNHKFYDGEKFTPVSEMQQPAWSESQEVLFPELLLQGPPDPRSDCAEGCGVTSALGRPETKGTPCRGSESFPPEKRTFLGSVQTLWKSLRHSAAQAFLLPFMRRVLDGSTTPCRRIAQGRNAKTSSRPRLQTASGCGGAHDERQPLATARSSGENWSGSARAACPTPERGEWAWADDHTAIAVQSARTLGFRDGVGDQAREGQQNDLARGDTIRFSFALGATGGGTRRTITQRPRRSGAGRSENAAGDRAWVAGGEVQECRDSGEPRPLRRDHTVAPVTVESRGTADTVFDLEVEGVHCYYANGFLVSNCHRFSGQDTANAHILKAAPKPLLMLSATCADSPIKMRAIGHQLGLTTWEDWYGWCFKNGCRKNVPFGGLKFIGGEETLHRIHKAIFPQKGVRLRIADLGNAFPENSVEAVPIPVDEADALDHEYLAALEALEAEAPNSAVLLLRARQKSEFLKIPAIVEMAEDLLEEGKSVAIFVCFRDTLDRLAEDFPQAALVYGEQDADEREQAIATFQSNEKRVVIATIQAGGVGVSLHDLHGEHPRVSLICPTYSAVDLKQALGRIHRNGAKTPAIQRVLFASDTVEERVRRKVQKKIDNIQAINDGDLTPQDGDETNTTT